MSNMPNKRSSLSPAQAVDRLESIHTAATGALRRALERYVSHGPPPTAAQRRKFRYPELCLTWAPSGPAPVTRRAWAKIQIAGTYITTVTQPGFFRRYLLEQLRPLVEEYGVTLDVRVSEREIPYPYVFEEGDELVHGDISAAELARHFPTPIQAPSTTSSPTVARIGVGKLRASSAAEISPWTSSSPSSKT